jgi:dihydropteroate synthase
MAVVNVTPDSFSGDGVGGDVAAAVELARRFDEAGADLIDLGGASSRPGAPPLDPAEERRRVLPALAAVRAATTLPISVDTCHAEVAGPALDAGADLINDIHGLRFDPELAKLAARRQAPVVAMHNQRGRECRDVAADIRRGFEESLRIAREAGVDPGRIILDPGFGFGWTPAQNLEMVRRLPELWDLELSLLIGVSRKSTIGAVTGTAVEDRVEGTAAAVALAIAGGVDIVRVHDLPQMLQVTRVADAIVRPPRPGMADAPPPGSDRVAVVLALGANLGDRLANLRAATELLGQHGVTVTARSSVWETEPVPPGQPRYLNAVVAARTALAPRELLAALKAIERQLGREPGPRWGPRPIDLDILFYDALRLDTPELTIPHPRLTERAFVLAPLAEAWPGDLPVLGRSASELLRETGSEGVTRTGDALS